MRIFSFISITLILFNCKQQSVISYTNENGKVECKFSDGILTINPLSDNTVRIQYGKPTETSLPELVFIEPHEVPSFEVNETGNSISIILKNLVVEVNKKNGSLSYFNSEGNLILKEKAASRIVKPDSVKGEACFFVEQAFESPADESIFGLGQFQDGHFNVKGISRRLIQVNSQIAIPFIYSSMGYGLMWHQYGLTDFNPADNFIELTKQEIPAENEKLIEVTTTAGTQKVAQNQSLYTGGFNVPSDGEYSVFLDLGDMGNRHFVVIDGKPIIDQSNMWLPPAVGALVYLESGTHKVQIVCKSDNQPKLSWKLKDNFTIFRSPHCQKLDYLVFAGSADEVIESYRNLSGQAPMFPKWAYGFWQCRERYTSSGHLIETVKEFRKRKLPMDVIVQDWQYWGNRGWGVPQFDEKNYPDPPKFINEIHALNAHFNISIWSNPDKNSEIGKTYVSNGRFIPGTKWLDYFNPDTRAEYWNTLKENMFDYGVDSWWMDAVEPENDALKGESTHIGRGDFYRLTYPLMVSKAVYEGQRATTEEKRVCILTRSAFSGQQRYGIINWSGDIGGDWDAFRRQIVAGLNYSISGLPNWTTDIGGFFRPGSGQYTDENYRELLIRWFQWGTFNPIFRMHGYMSETEPWKYGQKVENLMRNMLNLRYQLLPYIYSEAWQVSNGSTLMRPMIMDFSNDPIAVRQPFQFMFGKAFMVAPVIESGETQRELYLPKTADWFDFWTGKYYTGGQNITIEAPLDRIPLFIKAGSIVPVGPVIQFSSEVINNELEMRIYEGADGTFTLYEDEGDNYNYETGKYSTITFTWNNANRKLSISERKGTFEGLLVKRDFKLVLVLKEDQVETKNKIIEKKIIYEGFETETKLQEH